MEYDLNAPAFGPGSQNAEGTQDAAPASVEQPEVQEEESVESVEENKVPYSRFKNIHNRALEAEARAAEYQAQLDALRAQSFREPHREETTLPSDWVEMYGDSDASKRAWERQQEMNEQIKYEAREEALNAVREERTMEVERINTNLETIDEQIDALSAYVGRDLTDKEQSAILDIVDEFTPQDEEGNYIGATIPFDKAWEIYEMKTQSQNSPRRQARDSIAGLSGSASQGETSIGGEKNKDFNPLDWNAWKKRI